MTDGRPGFQGELVVLAQDTFFIPLQNTPFRPAKALQVCSGRRVELDRVKVKGKNEPVAIFQPIGLERELDTARRSELVRWQNALDLFRAQRWDAAAAIVRELHMAYPDQFLYELYLENIERFRANSPGSDWDGVTTYKTK